MLQAELRTKRIASGISGAVLCLKIGMSRSRLSAIERGYIDCTPEELVLILEALQELFAAKERIVRAAIDAGWPSAVEVR